MSKAFDCVDHSILLNKLHHFGIRGVAFKWFESYFLEREQIVTYANEISLNKNLVKCGTPQGSVLAPLLYLIYVNDMYSCTCETTPIFYADDTTLISFQNSENDVVNSINRDLAQVNEWLICNKLTLNSGKSKFIMFERKKKKEGCDLHVAINDDKIKRVSTTKFLGILINEKLSWKEHMMKILSKIQRNLGLIYKIKHYLNKNVLLQLYYSMIFCHIKYGILFGITEI